MVLELASLGGESSQRPSLRLPRRLFQGSSRQTSTCEGHMVVAGHRADRHKIGLAFESVRLPARRPNELSGWTFRRFVRGFRCNPPPNTPVPAQLAI